MKTRRFLPALAAVILLSGCQSTAPSRFDLADTDGNGSLTRAEMSDA